MKVKELIAELERLNPEVEVYISVYDCGGINDLHGIDNIDQFDPDEAVNLAINVGCDTHRKWSTQQNCPVEKLQKTIAQCEDLKKTIDYYKEQLTFLEKRFSERNKKEGK